MIKALFFDIDGTLVSFNTHAIPESTIEAIATAKAKGIRIFIATGRPTAIINNLSALQDRDLIDGYITMNGGYCFVGKEVIYKSAIPTADVQTLAHIAGKEKFPCIFVGEHDICVCQPDEMVRKVFYDYLKVDSLPVKTLEEAIRKEVFQMTPFITQEQEKLILPQLHGCEAGRWFPAFTDMTAKGSTKQKGIDEVIRHFNISLEETMAFGDGGNDAGMLRHAAIGVAMGNALEEVKAYADYVTTSVDENGIANALREFSIIE
ncbi:Cof-type HAD-IIB family hydrolase [Bacteroides sp. UBA939]|uniref:Cof-type HAD-IIB family hydrolase n=1 Tax=Bacteroides sp. UBA939 TaxID=1946092 RepID=UPI0025C44DC3|nr:Cof-type HAD-IIB family hydrolase [Bacteroides sp. UBA939]